MFVNADITPNAIFVATQKAANDRGSGLAETIRRQAEAGYDPGCAPRPANCSRICSRGVAPFRYYIHPCANGRGSTSFGNWPRDAGSETKGSKALRHCSHVSRLEVVLYF